MIAYSGRSVPRPRYYANDHSRDVLETTLIEMDVMDARARAPTLDDAGFTLVAHRSAVGDFADRAAIEAIHRPEIVALVRRLSGADTVLVNSPGILRFSERSPQSGVLDNSRPARFAHVDVSDATAAVFAQRAAPPGRPLARRASRTAAGALRALQHLARALAAAAGRAAGGVRCAQCHSRRSHRGGCGVRLAGQARMVLRGPAAGARRRTSLALVPRHAPRRGAHLQDP